MALIKCPECGKEISDKAPACIHCGYPLENIQTKESRLPTAAPSQPRFDLHVKGTGKPEETKSTSLGFSIVSNEGNTVGLQCEKCRRISDYLKGVVLSDVSEKEAITNTTICCPGCGNTMRKGQKIKFKQVIQVASKSEGYQVSRKQDDASGSGCLIWLILVGILVAIGMFLVTDGFSDFALWWLVFPLTFAALILVGLIYSFVTSDPKEVKESWDKEKYNDYKFTCPMCGSKKVKKIGTVNRAASVAAVGLASSKIGKQYECDDCKHKW